MINPYGGLGTGLGTKQCREHLGTVFTEIHISLCRKHYLIYTELADQTKETLREQILGYHKVAPMSVFWMTVALTSPSFLAVGPPLA